MLPTQDTNFTLEVVIYSEFNTVVSLRPLHHSPAEDVQTHVDPGHEEEEAGQQPHGGGELRSRGAAQLSWAEADGELNNG